MQQFSLPVEVMFQNPQWIPEAADSTSNYIVSPSSYLRIRHGKILTIMIK